MGDVPAAILAGGLATRLGPLVSEVPKALVDIAGRPFIEHQLELLRRNGVRRVVLCVGHRGEQIEARLGDGASLGLDLAYSHDGPRLLGTGGALRRAAELLGHTFWVLYGDSYMDIDYAAVLADHLSSPTLGTMTVLRNDDRWDRSNAVFRDGRLVRYDKKARTPEMTHIDYGVSLLRRVALLRIPPDEPYDVADLYRDLVQEGQMRGYEVTRRFYEIGTPEGLAETRRFLGGPESA
jgi:NDP-sugar pyrophosphorylase family protein